MTVPTQNTIRLAVINRSGGSVKAYQNGEAKNIRTNAIVNAGRVVAEVAVCGVERKSVNSKNGASKMLQRPVKACRVETISSRDLRCSTGSVPVFSATKVPCAQLDDDIGDLRR